MTATYTDIVDAMIEASSRDLSAEKVVLEEESIDTFLADDNFTEEDKIRQEERIGVEWTIEIESGDSNYLLTESGERIDL